MPVTASIRRTPAATPVWPVKRKGPTCPVVRTWVPPQSSIEGPICTTRTTSPYFSEKNAIAPSASASG